MRRNSIETEWIFDVEEFDEESISISLLQELEIDIQLIFQTIKWMLSYPWFWFFISSSSSSVHPLASHVSQREFWGPCFVVCLTSVDINNGTGELIWDDTLVLETAGSFFLYFVILIRMSCGCLPFGELLRYFSR